MDVSDIKRLLENHEKDFGHLKCRPESFSLIDSGVELITVDYARVAEVIYQGAYLHVRLKNGLVYLVPQNPEGSCRIQMPK